MHRYTQTHGHAACELLLPCLVFSHPLTTQIRTCRLAASVIDFLLLHVSSWIIQEYARVTRRETQQLSPAWSKGSKLSCMWRWALTRWGQAPWTNALIYPGRLWTSRWGCLHSLVWLPRSLLNSLISTAAPEDVLLLFHLELMNPHCLIKKFLSNFLFVGLSLRGNMKLTYFCRITWKYFLFNKIGT